MDFIIGILLGTRLFTILTGGLAPGDLQAYFAPPQIAVVQQQVLVTCRLVNPYPKQLRELAMTATPVLLYVTFELRDVAERDPLVTHVEESVLAYDLVGKTFTVSRSGGSGPLRVAGLDSAIAVAADFHEVSMVPLGQITADHLYQMVIYAVLGKTRVEALDNKEVDLMYYWDYKRPMIKTEKFKGEALLQLKK
jgi:hypothetical protein